MTDHPGTTSAPEREREEWGDQWLTADGTTPGQALAAKVTGDKVQVQACDESGARVQVTLDVAETRYFAAAIETAYLHARLAENARDRGRDTADRERATGARDRQAPARDR